MKKYIIFLLVFLALGWGAGITPQPARAQNDLWTELERLADSAVYRIRIATNQARYRVNDEMVLTCQIEKTGYLNVLHVQRGDKGATVLFPNKYHPENRVRANTTIRIPGRDEFTIRALPPTGEHLVVVLHTEMNINAYRDAQGSKDALFKTVTTQFIKKFEIEEKKETYFGAGKIITVVKR